MNETKKRGWVREGENGFTLIELLIAIVVAGILTTVAIIGIGSLADNGKSSACKATADAAKAASAVFYANSATNAYPTSFTDLINGKELDNSAGLVDGGSTLTNTGKWTVTMAGGGATAPTFTCGPAV